jgi:ATP-binding cassette subfamily B protein
VRARKGLTVSPRPRRSIPLLQYRSLLGAYLLPHWRLTLALVLLLFGTIALELANPQILRHFIDTARAGSQTGSLMAVAGLFLGVAVATQIVSVAQTYVAENLGWMATNRLRSDLALHCLLLDPSFHNVHSPGELIERIDGDVSTLGNFFSRFVVYVLANLLLLIGILVMLFRIDWRVGAALTLFTLVSLSVVRRIAHVGAPHWASSRQAAATLMGYIEERLSGTEDIRSSGATQYAMRGLHSRSREFLRTTRKAAIVGSSVAWATILLFTIGTAVALGLGAYLYEGGAITIGTLYLIFNYTQMLNRPIEEVTRQLSDFQQAAAGVARIGALLDIRSVISDGRGDPLPTGPLEVQFRDVTFAYEDDPPVLDGVSFVVPPGSRLGVLGRTGSGKTTLSRLLFRLYDPCEGSVCLSGVDLRDARVAEVRARVGMVTQDIQLFHATVRDNLTLFDAGVPDSRIEEVLNDLGLWRWCTGLGAGLNMMLVSGASGLSAGEAQLLAFARVFLKEPDLVILDEASSRLDPATEGLIEHAVERLLEGRTGIVIAHRLHTLRRVDDILMLEDGRIQEQGPRAQLAADPDSHFSSMLATGLEVNA